MTFRKSLIALLLVFASLSPAYAWETTPKQFRIMNETWAMSLRNQNLVIKSVELCVPPANTICSGAIPTVPTPLWPNKSGTFQFFAGTPGPLTLRLNTVYHGTVTAANLFDRNAYSKIYVFDGSSFGTFIFAYGN